MERGAESKGVGDDELKMGIMDPRTFVPTLYP